MNVNKFIHIEQGPMTNLC